MKKPIPNELKDYAPEVSLHGTIYSFYDFENGSGQKIFGWYPPKHKRKNRENPDGLPIYKTLEELKRAIAAERNENFY